jgi:hypothetical protein
MKLLREKEIEKAGFRQVAEHVWRKKEKIILRCNCGAFSGETRIVPEMQIYHCPVCDVQMEFTIK